MTWDVENRWKYDGTVVVGIGRCVYGIPCYSEYIMKYDPINGTTSIVGEEGDEVFQCKGGALGRDGCIYTLAEDAGRVLKIDRVDNSHGFVGNSIESDHGGGMGWCDAVLGIDGYIY